MKVILVTEGYPPKIGGLEKVVYEVAHRLSTNGHDVSVVTIAADTTATFEIDNKIKIYRLKIKKIGSAKDAVKNLFLLIKNVFLLLQIFHKEKPDVANIHYIGYLSSIFYIVNKVVRVPYIASIHGTDIEKTEQNVSKIKKMLIKKILSGSNCIFSNSGALLKTAQKLTGNHLVQKSIVIGNGINLSNYKNVFRPSVRDTIIGIGRFVHKKGFDVLIQAFYQIQNENEQARLILAGSGPELEKCKNLSKSLGIDEKVTFLGFVNNENIQDLFEKAAVFVLPSRMEAFGVVLLEAMASGVPIVATATGGIPGIITDGINGTLVPPGNPDSLAQAILLLLENKDVRIRYSSTALDFVKKYDWDSIIHQYEKNYRLCSEMRNI